MEGWINVCVCVRMCLFLEELLYIVIRFHFLLLSHYIYLSKDELEDLFFGFQHGLVTPPSHGTIHHELLPPLTSHTPLFKMSTVT